MYHTITDPKTNRKLSIYNKNGQDVLRNYITILNGGAKTIRPVAEIKFYQENSSIIGYLDLSNLPNTSSSNVEVSMVPEEPQTMRIKLNQTEDVEYTGEFHATPNEEFSANDITEVEEADVNRLFDIQAEMIKLKKLAEKNILENQELKLKNKELKQKCKRRKIKNKELNKRIATLNELNEKYHLD